MNEMMHRVGLAVVIAFAPVAAAAAPTTPAASQTSAEADRSVATFFGLMRAGRSAEAVDGLFGSNVLMNGKTAEKQQLVAQTDTALKIYGPIVGFEMVEEKTLGTLAARRYYLVQHTNMLTRWEFDFARTGDRLSVVYFGFNDQVPSWF